jgi:hypothetical protein
MIKATMSMTGIVASRRLATKVTIALYSFLAAQIGSARICSVNGI